MNKARREEAIQVLDKEIERQRVAIADEKKRENVVANLKLIRQTLANGEDSLKLIPCGRDAFGGYMYNEILESLRAATLTVDEFEYGIATILDDRYVEEDEDDEDDF